MTKQYDDTNRGVLFPNDRKTSDKHPDQKGWINVEGTKYWVSGWDKIGKTGEMTSLSLTRADERTRPANDQRVSDDHGDAIPF